MELLREEVSALKARVESDKTTMAQLKDTNDSLQSKLESKPSLPSPSENGQVGETQSVNARERIVYLPKEKKCPVFSGGSSAVFYDWLD